MARRRMIAKELTDGDDFAEMSASAQALYLHLSMAADDDGFCDQVRISMFRAHASEQDLAELEAKGFIYRFENGPVLILHWRLSNEIRKDRYVPTVYREEMDLFEITESKKYRLKNGNQLATNWQPNDNQMAAQDRLGKVRIDKKDILSPCGDSTPEGEGESSTPKAGKKQKSDGNKELVAEVIDYLNAKIKAHYKANTPNTVTLINKRIKDGYTIEDFKTVINKKYASWGNDPKMQAYLRPETLFGNKFEGYLNEKAAAGDRRIAPRDKVKTADEYAFDPSMMG